MGYQIPSTIKMNETCKAALEIYDSQQAIHQPDANMLISQKCHEMYYVESMTSHVLIVCTFADFLLASLFKARRVRVCNIPDQISLTTHN